MSAAKRQDIREIEREVVLLRAILRRLLDLSAQRDAAMAVLEVIAESGGTTTDDGLACTGSWCAEQARAFLCAVQPAPRNARGGTA